MRQIMVKKSLLLGWLLCISQLCVALPNDNTQVLHVQAGAADINQHTLRGTYINDVQLTQGSTHLHASEASTTTDSEHQLILAIIKGSDKKQAHYWTKPDVNKPIVHAYADVIKYYPKQHLIELTGHARVIQGKNSFSAPTIRYDTINQHVMSNGVAGHERTRLIFYPEGKHFHE